MTNMSTSRWSRDERRIVGDTKENQPWSSQAMNPFPHRLWHGDPKRSASVNWAFHFSAFRPTTDCMAGLRDGSCARGCLDRLLDACSVSQVVVTNGFEIVIKFLPEQHCPGNIQMNELLLRDVLPVFHQDPQATSMCRN